ncbi:MAG TPA: glycosyltransferase family A protein [Candidatus Cloacimonadota bacterium]|nr:glycosyltransferase family A protein [Candidatus Cloacimonadota bacterium]HPS38834.1 glycosyltransferase family A protein [Candidatus Cloacimonadota bacterium]
MNEPVTAIFFSCRRLDLLHRTVDAFVKANTYPLYDLIIVNDSGDPRIHEQLEVEYPLYHLVLHGKNEGLIKSIDLGYARIGTEYFFHCEDDWLCNGKGGFIEASLSIMQERPDIEEVWLADYNKHPMDSKFHITADGVLYLLASENIDGWHGFTTACGLKRMSDYRKVAPYSEIPWEKTIWHRERAIGEEYHKLGYRTAVLSKDYAINIGIGKSEYITGYEK